MYLPLLLLSPVQHAMTQHGSFFRARDVEDWQLSVNRGVNCALLAWFFVSHHRSLLFALIPCLPMLVRVIIITIVVSTSLSTSRPAYASATCAGATAITCTACGLLAHFGSVCQLQTLTVRGVFIPIDFGHWDLLSMLLLNVGDEFSHLIGTPTSLCKSFLQSSRQAMVDEKGGEGFSSSDVGWARWQGEVNLLLHTFWCLRSLRRLWGILIWSLIRGLFQHHLPVCSSPLLGVLLRVALASSSSHCQRLASCVFPYSLLGSCHVTRRPPPHSCTVKGLCLGKARSSFI